MLQNLQGRELRDAMYIQDQYQEGSGSSMASSAKGDDEREGGTDDDDLKNGLSTQDGAEGKAEFKEPKKRKEDKEEEVEMPAQKPVSVEEANKGAVEASAIDVFASESDLSDLQFHQAHARTDQIGSKAGRLNCRMPVLGVVKYGDETYFEPSETCDEDCEAGRRSVLEGKEGKEGHYFCSCVPGMLNLFFRTAHPECVKGTEGFSLIAVEDPKGVTGLYPQVDLAVASITPPMLAALHKIYSATAQNKFRNRLFQKCLETQIYPSPLCLVR